MKLGIALPIRGGSDAVEIARHADTIGIDGIFVFDHYSRRSDPSHLLPTEPLSFMGYIASSTKRVRIGSLVYRIGLDPIEALTNAFRSLRILSSDRIIAGIGAGSRSFERDCSNFGIGVKAWSDRLTEVERVACQLADAGVETWIGGLSKAISDIAIRNRVPLNWWNVSPSEFKKRLDHLGRDAAVATWAGNCPTSGDSSVDLTKLESLLTGLRNAGASWAVLMLPPKDRISAMESCMNLVVTSDQRSAERHGCDSEATYSETN